MLNIKKLCFVIVYQTLKNLSIYYFQTAKCSAILLTISPQLDDRYSITSLKLWAEKYPIPISTHTRKHCPNIRIIPNGRTEQPDLK